jgi:hypothetical protein
MSFSWKGYVGFIEGSIAYYFVFRRRRQFFKFSNKRVVLHLIEGISPKAVLLIPMLLKELLDKFENVFEEPKGLPPKISHDHRILLKEDSKPLCVRPYKYPYSQKTEIEKIARQLLKSRVIRPSQSPFSSPVLLVRKADGS